MIEEGTVQNVSASYYLPVELKKRVEREAFALERSASWVVEKVLREHFEKLDELHKSQSTRKGTEPLEKGK